MPISIDQCYHAQIVVNDDRLIFRNYANAHPNDKQEFLPTIESVPDELKPQITSSPLRLPIQAIILSKTSIIFPRPSHKSLQNQRKNTTVILNNLYTQQKIRKKRFIERGNIQWNLFLA